MQRKNLGVLNTINVHMGMGVFMLPFALHLSGIYFVSDKLQWKMDREMYAV